MTTPTIVSGAISSVTELDLDEAWLKGWLQEQPTRLGLGELEVSEGLAEADDRSFVATDEQRCFSVDVRLHELEAAHGFQLLDNWARNRVRHPDKSHVAVLVTERVGERYQPTLETLAEHLPLVVIEVQVWRGENEAILVPHVALASDAVDLTDTPAAKAAHAVARAGTGPGAAAEADNEPGAATDAGTESSEAAETDIEPSEAAGITASTTSDAEPDAMAEDEPEPSESAGMDDATGHDQVTDHRDDTGVGNPWGLPQPEPGDGDTDSNGSSGRRLLTRIGG